MPVQFGLRMNQRNQAVTQYLGYEFESMAVWNGRSIAIDENGIYEIFSGHTDNGEPIEAQLDLPQMNLGTLALKRIRAVLVGARIDGALEVAVEDDDRKTRHYYMTPFLKNNEQQLLRVTAGRNYHKGSYYTIGIRNVDGSDFMLDIIQAIPIVLSRKPVRW
ncbi:MAG: hypothetical protein V5B78_12940 [Desulfohalobiaceae bacterium]